MKRQPISNVGKSRRQAGLAVALKNILVPTDFSAASGKAVRYAVALAAQFHASVTLLHIAEAGSMGYEHGAEDFPRMELQLRSAAERQMADLGVDGAGIEFKIARGWPFGGKRSYHEIVEAARKQRADLVVISTHGRTAFDHLIMGSTAERVVRYAPCPVLVVRADEHDFIAARTRVAKPRKTPRKQEAKP